MNYLSTKRIATIVGLAGLCLLAPSANAQTTILDFEGLADSASVTNQYTPQGVTFQANTTALVAGIGLNDVDFPPHSGVTVVTDDGGAISGLFATPVSDFGGFFTYAQQITLTALDAGGMVLATVQSSGANNSNGPGGSATPNEFLSVASVTPIARFTISGDPNGGSFVLDDFQFTPQAVPEPSAAATALLGIGGAFLLLRRRFTAR